MKDSDGTLEKRMGIIKMIGPDLASQIGNALRKLTAENIKVEYKNAQVYKQNKISIDTDKTCFGSYVNFISPENDFEGIVMAIFSLDSSNILTDLLLRKYLDKWGKEKIDDKMRLSAFKEAVNIMISTYITGVANALKYKLSADMSRFICFNNMDFIKPALLKYSKTDNMVSVGQFNIAGEVPIEGRFIIVF